MAKLSIVLKWLEANKVIGPIHTIELTEVFSLQMLQADYTQVFYTEDKGRFESVKQEIEAALEDAATIQVKSLDGGLNALLLPPISKEALTFSLVTTEELMEAIFARDIWAQDQSHESLVPYLKEETEEVVQAIENKDYDNLIEELGDLILQIMYHIQVAKTKHQQDYTIASVLKVLNEKLIRRHPHVFGDVEVSSIEELDALWQSIKKKEKEGGADAFR